MKVIMIFVLNLIDKACIMQAIIQCKTDGGVLKAGCIIFKINDNDATYSSPCSNDNFGFQFE